MPRSEMSSPAHSDASPERKLVGGGYMYQALAKHIRFSFEEPVSSEFAQKIQSQYGKLGEAGPISKSCASGNAQ